mgnify:CR=1 FL=1
MSMLLPLFEDPPPELAASLGPRLAALAAEGVYIGGSSWKYPGWLGQIYTPEKYRTRGRFSQKKFEAECLEEYAKTFPIVCGDFSFYQFPSDAFWQRLFASASPSLRYGFKVPEEITVKRFPMHDRYGARAGLTNEFFLHPDMFAENFWRPLETYKDRVAVLIFEFGTFSKEAFAGEAPFVEQLDRFLGALPKGPRYSVEVRNPEFLAADYFACLQKHNVAHVFNAWTRMPELGVQMSIADAFSADFTVVRALLRRGRAYEDAVKAFSPYERVQDANPPGRVAIRSLIARARQVRQPAFVFVNNRFEGNAPQTIDAILKDG